MTAGRQEQEQHRHARPLEGQVAIVTGASSGIGRGVAVELARSGAHVVINYVSGPDAAEAVSRECRETGSLAIPIQADVSKEDQVEAMFAETCAELGTVHILVNNAGIQRDANVDEMTLAEWQQVMDVNLTGQFLCARSAVREFKRRGMQPEVSRSLGKIVHMSSVHEVIPWAGHANYAASKGGVMLFMKSLAQEVAVHRIRVNGIAPGAIQTPINQDAWQNKEALRNLLNLIPYGRIGQPVDIARGVVWLASDESEYVTGTTLYIDGGMTLYPGFRGNG
jgi:glucose 1-dehydrogenase